MRKELLYIFLILATLAACNVDDEATGMQQGNRIILEVPVEWVPTNGTTVENRVGDPGIKEEMPAPTYLYAFTWLRAVDVGSAQDHYECVFTQRTNLTAIDWVLVDKGTQSERYTLSQPIRMELSEAIIKKDYVAGEQLGRTYAIASGRALTTAELKAIVGTDCASLIDKPGEIVNVSKTIGAALDAQLGAATLGIDAWSQTELRDLYSTPYGDAALDNDGLKNGSITYDRTKFPELGIGHGAVRLYHVAAKIDFQWEVPAALQDTTAVASITVNNLPTTLHVFKPTANQTAEGTYSHTIGTDLGSQWIGRAYFYALQPQSATVSYTVTFHDLDGDGNKKADVSKSFTPEEIHPAYTGWFRIPALVK